MRPLEAKPFVRAEIVWGSDAIKRGGKFSPRNRFFSAKCRGVWVIDDEWLLLL